MGYGTHRSPFLMLMFYIVPMTTDVWVPIHMLAQSYEINLGYPMPRATFMGGVSVNF